jgi:hypothetical protein
MKINKLGFILILSVLSLTSCDYAYDYTYEVTNDTDSEVKIKVQTFRIDSTYSISANETQILFVTDHGLEGSKGPYFEDVAEELDEFIVTKNDTLISTKDYLDNSSWNYDDGLYHTTIENNEFE